MMMKKPNKNLQNSDTVSDNKASDLLGRIITTPINDEAEQSFCHPRNHHAEEHAVHPEMRRQDRARKNTDDRCDHRSGKHNAHRPDPAKERVEKVVDKIKKNKGQIIARKYHGIIKRVAFKARGEEETAQRRR